MRTPSGAEMPNLLVVTPPLFALVLAGYIAARRGLIEPGGIGDRDAETG